MTELSTAQIRCAIMREHGVSQSAVARAEKVALSTVNRVVFDRYGEATSKGQETATRIRARVAALTGCTLETLGWGDLRDGGDARRARGSENSDSGSTRKSKPLPPERRERGGATPVAPPQDGDK